VLPALEAFHPEVLQTSLSTEQEARLREALGGALTETMVAASAVVEAGPAVAKAEDLASGESGFRYLFDNTPDSFENWRFVGERGFGCGGWHVGGTTAEDWGVLYYTTETFGDSDLGLDFKFIVSTATPPCSCASAIRCSQSQTEPTPRLRFRTTVNSGSPSTPGWWAGQWNRPSCAR
jgi:hypothetical protein